MLCVYSFQSMLNVFSFMLRYACLVGYVCVVREGTSTSRVPLYTVRPDSKYMYREGASVHGSSRRAYYNQYILRSLYLVELYEIVTHTLRQFS